MRSIDQLKDFHQEVLMPKLAALEQKRLATRLRIKNLYIGAGLLIFVLSVLFLSKILAIYYYLAACAVIAYAVVVLFRQFAQEALMAGQFRELIYTSMLSYIFPEAFIDPQRHIDAKYFSESRIFLETPNAFGGRNAVKAELNERPLLFSEVKAAVLREGRKQTEARTLLDGYLFVTYCGVPFKGHTIVVADDSEARLDYIGKLICRYNVFRDPIVHFTDEDFNNLYSVYSTHPLEAQQLLSVELRDHILQFTDETGMSVQLAFGTNKIYIAINHGGTLLPFSATTPVTDFRYLEDLYQPFELVAYIASYINDLKVPKVSVWDI